MKDEIIEVATSCLSSKGYEGTSMRDIAALVNIKTSGIYYYFENKAALFDSVYMHIIATLRQDIAPIRTIDDPSKRLRAVLAYQFRQRKMLAALLNYFVARSDRFQAGGDGGYVPMGAYHHVLECLEAGATIGRYHSHTTQFDAKIIAHIMNGFILEYANRPLPEKQCDQLVEAIASFIEAATTSEEVL